MKRKGFTLIELLAVIVILAIIALIATPIVLNIIENTKEEANERSVDMYVRAVNNAILEYELKNKKAPLLFSDIEEYIEYGGATVDCSTKKLTNNKSITLSGCKVNGSTTTYKYENGKVEEVEPICTLADDSTIQGTNTGAKYLCKVKDEMEEEYSEGYPFYVLGNNLDGTTNLIMFANIYEDGQPIDSDPVEGSGVVAWYAENSCSEDEWGACTNEYGPETAMNYLNTATSEWKEELRLNETYTDEGGNYGTITLNGKARLPKYSEVDYEDMNENPFLYDYMDVVGFEETGLENYESLTSIDSVNGYWTLSSNNEDFCSGGSVWSINSWGISYETCVFLAEYGVRPVITVQL